VHESVAYFRELKKDAADGRIDRSAQTNRPKESLEAPDARLEGALDVSPKAIGEVLRPLGRCGADERQYGPLEFLKHLLVSQQVWFLENQDREVIDEDLQDRPETNCRQAIKKIKSPFALASCEGLQFLGLPLRVFISRLGREGIGLPKNFGHLASKLN